MTQTYTQSQDVKNRTPVEFRYYSLGQKLGLDRKNELHFGAHILTAHSFFVRAMWEMHFFIFAYVSFVTVVFNSCPGGPPHSA